MPIVSPKEAIQILLRDQVVAVPTETVYGLAARISSHPALQQIFTTKERPLFDPLIVHAQDLRQARGLASDWPAVIDRLARKFWPGPLTLVVPKNKQVDPLITAGLETVGLRVPSHPVALEILKGLQEPFAAPSANRFGRTSPTRVEHVLSEFADQIPVVDGGPCEVGLESTVLRLTTSETLEILRPGAITSEQIRLALDPDFLHIRISRATSNASPGHLEQHYRPRLPLVIVHKSPSAGLRLDLAQRQGIRPEEIFDLRLARDPRLAAREMYHRMLTLSQNPQGCIVYWAGEEWNDPAWAAIVDRLSRAALFQIHE